jgi:hypothetical protein
MEGSPIDIVIFAPLAPILGVILFWFIQLLFIESQKFLLQKIRSKHEPLCRFTNFLGILFQSICHALGYTVTKSGVSEFYLSVSYGKVAPKKEKKGIFEWIANVFLFIGPFFIPALLLLILYLLGTGYFEITTPANIEATKYTFGGQITAFGANLHNFSQNFFTFLYRIDLLHPGHFGFLLLMIFLGMGIRPSHIGEQKLDKVDMIYDLRNIWSLITHKPLYVIVLLLFVYNIFYISIIFDLVGVDQNWYLAISSIFGWISLIAIVSLIITHFILILIRFTDEIPGKLRYLPYLTLPVSYVLMRLVFFYFPTDFMYSVSLLVMIICTVIVTYILLRRKSNKFKTERDIKSLNKKGKAEKDARTEPVEK